MAYLTDIQIAQACEKKPITEIAKKAHIDEKYIELYGRWKARWTRPCSRKRTVPTANWCW